MRYADINGLHRWVGEQRFVAAVTADLSEFLREGIGACLLTAGHGNQLSGMRFSQSLRKGLGDAASSQDTPRKWRIGCAHILKSMDDENFPGNRRYVAF